MAIIGENYFINVSGLSGSTVKNVTIMHYTSRTMSVPVASRRQSTFMHVVSGCYRYRSERVDFLVEPGDTVYVPIGAEYTYSIVSHASECLQVEFDIEDENGEVVRLSDDPTLHKGDGERLKPIFEKMLLGYRENSFGVTASIYILLSLFDADRDSEKLEKSGEYRIAPAVRYIKENFRKKMYVSELAELCGFSEPHLRRLFKLYIGCSPAEYRSKLLSDAARDMLLKSDLNISDVAYELNFPDIYSFSQFFKRLNGMSPRDFINRRKKG